MKSVIDLEKVVSCGNVTLCFSDSSGYYVSVVDGVHTATKEFGFGAKAFIEARKQMEASTGKSFKDIRKGVA